MHCDRMLATRSERFFNCSVGSKHHGTHFFLNFTRIVENNPRIYWSIIFGIAGCLVLFYC